MHRSLKNGYVLTSKTSLFRQRDLKAGGRTQQETVLITNLHNSTRVRQSKGLKMCCSKLTQLSQKASYFYRFFSDEINLQHKYQSQFQYQMIRQKITKFLTYSGAQTRIKKSIAGAISLAFSYSLLKDPLSITKQYDQIYDLAVIGGGSAGLATATEANQHGLSVIVIDYVEASQHKTKWGLGGTCVNVGCIPKKLMHQAAKYHEELMNANDYGWELGVNSREKDEEIVKSFNWQKLQKKIQMYIKSMNFGYIAKINGAENMDYLNCLATFKDKQTLICAKKPQIIYNYLKNGELPEFNKQNPSFFEIKAKNFVISTGTRPSYIKIEGAEHAITSDDIFYRKTAPGKTLVVGGGYVGVEIAGFLRGMGYQVSMMTRGDYLRPFDHDMVNEVINDLKQRKVIIHQTSLPQSIRKNENGRLDVIIKNQKTGQVRQVEQFDTVLFAVGRHATTDTLNLKAAGVQTAKNKKIQTRADEVERTNVDHIYALGDVVEGLPELTSTANKMGKNLGRRIVQLLGKSKFAHHEKYVDLENYPTTIFTPLQYSCCGMNERNAQEKFGKDNIDVYHIKFTPLEEQILDKENEDRQSTKTNAYAKAIVHKETDKVLGLHFTGPNAGEVMQGFAVAMRLGLTKAQLDSTISIHPTSAEDITKMDATKTNGKSFEKTSC